MSSAGTYTARGPFPLRLRSLQNLRAHLLIGTIFISFLLHIQSFVCQNCQFSFGTMDDLQQRLQARERGGSAPSLASLVTNRCFLTLPVIRIWNTNRSFLDRTQTRIFLEFLFNSDKNYSIAFLDKTDPKAISYNVLILKTENGGFSTFAGVLDPGTERIGAAVLKFRLAFFRDASNGVGRFFRITFFLFQCTAVSSKSVSDAIYPKNRSFFRMKLRQISETGFAIYIF